MDTTRKSARKLLEVRTYLAADLPFFHNRFMGSRQKTDFDSQVDRRGCPNSSLLFAVALPQNGRIAV